MGELLEAVAVLGGVVLVVGVIGWASYRTSGSQVLGVPAMIGVLVIAAAATAFSSGGLLAIVAIVVGLLVLMLVIGMAMTIGPEQPSRAEDERPMDDFRP